MLIYVFIKVWHWARWQYHIISFKFILILSLHLRLCLTRYLFPSARRHVLCASKIPFSFYLIFITILSGRSQWSRGLRHELSSLALWNSGFEFHSGHRCLCCVRLFCVCVVLCIGRGLAADWSPSKESYRLGIRPRNWKTGQGQTKDCRAKIVIVIIIIIIIIIIIKSFLCGGVLEHHHRSPVRYTRRRRGITGPTATKTKFRGFSLQANYTDRVTAARRRS
jgi:hypothetical protein